MKTFSKAIASGVFWAAATLLVASAGGCVKLENLDYSTFRLPDMNEKLRLPSMTAPVVVDENKPVAADELVDAQGNCASTPMASAAPPAPATAEAAGNDPVTMPVNPALAVGGIALGMTECDVVKRAGPPEKVAIGQNERGERTLSLTYLHNTRPGIYNFTAGRLATMERVDEPPPPPKAKPGKPAKPKPKPKTAI